VRIKYAKRRANLGAYAETTEELFLIVSQGFVLFEEYVHVNLIALGTGSRRFSHELSCLQHRQTKASSSEVVAGVQQEAAAAMVEDARVLDHIRVPTSGRHVNALISSPSRPGRSVLGHSMLNAVLLTSAAEPR
jgi:hypothetical protein